MSDFNITPVNFFKDELLTTSIVIVPAECGSGSGGCTCGSSGCSCFYGNNGQIL